MTPEGTFTLEMSYLNEQDSLKRHTDDRAASWNSWGQWLRNATESGFFAVPHGDDTFHLIPRERVRRILLHKTPGPATI